MPFADRSDAELLEEIGDQYDQISTVAKNLSLIAKGIGLPTDLPAREKLMESNRNFMVLLQGRAAELERERERRRRPPR